MFPSEYSPQEINTFTAKVDRGRFKYLRFNLPESTSRSKIYSALLP
jgi:hypothetical protein